MPECPVAAIERGKRVIVGMNLSLQVADHNYTKLSVIPSVILKVDILDNVDGSFYRGDVCVTVKEHAFQHLTTLRHACKFLETSGD